MCRCYVSRVRVTCVLGVVLDGFVVHVFVLAGFVLRLVGVLLKLIEVRCGERTKHLTPLHVFVIFMLNLLYFSDFFHFCFSMSFTLNWTRCDSDDDSFIKNQ